MTENGHTKCIILESQNVRFIEILNIKFKTFLTQIIKENFYGNFNSSNKNLSS